MSDPMFDHARQLLQNLVAIDSVNPSLDPGGAGEAEIARWIGEYCARLGLAVEYYEAAAPGATPSRPNVVAILHGARGRGAPPGASPPRSLILNGHTDTVALTGMDIPPLEPRYDEATHRVYGRGSADMKCGLAAMILAVQAIVASGDRLRGDVVLAGTVDEEYASIGTERLVQDVRADAGIVCEPHGLNITLAHKGFAWEAVEVTGKRVHGSRWEEGLDAIAKAGYVQVALDELNRRLTTGPRHPLLGPASVHAALIHGGVELSTYPDHVRLEIERRTIPGETREGVAAELQALLAGIAARDPAFHATGEVFFYRSPLEISRDEPIVQALARNVQRVLGRPAEYAAASGWMDSAIMAEAGIPTVIFGPTGSGGHAAVEWADVDSVVACARVLEATIRDFCA